MIFLMIIQTIILILILFKITDYNIYMLKDKIKNKIGKNEEDIILNRWLNDRN